MASLRTARRILEEAFRVVDHAPVIPDAIEAAKKTARQSRREVNRAISCPTCERIELIAN